MDYITSKTKGLDMKAFETVSIQEEVGARAQLICKRFHSYSSYENFSE